MENPEVLETSIYNLPEECGEKKIHTSTYRYLYEQWSSEGCSKAQKRFWRADWIFFSSPHLARFFPRPSGVTTCNEKQRVHGDSSSKSPGPFHAPSCQRPMTTMGSMNGQPLSRDEELQLRGTRELLQQPAAVLCCHLNSTHQVLPLLRQLIEPNVDKHDRLDPKWPLPQDSPPPQPLELCFFLVFQVLSFSQGVVSSLNLG